MQILRKIYHSLLKTYHSLPYFLRRFRIVDNSKFLFVRKNRHKISALARNGTPLEQTLDNSASGWDIFWKDEESITAYLSKDRRKFYEIVLKHLSPYLKQSLIEVGCGSGLFLQIIAKQFPQITLHGTDFSESSVAYCKKLIPQGTFFTSDICNMPIKELFDVVCCSQV